MSFSLGENVAAAVEYDTGRVLDCLGKAGFSDRLKTLPKGLETMLNKDFDESGVQVSGGEAQKIALARTLYKDAPFIILDEKFTKIKITPKHKKIATNSKIGINTSTATVIVLTPSSAKP